MVNSNRLELSDLPVETASTDELREMFIDNPDLAPQPRESFKAYTAFTDYCLMGPGRSIRKLLRAYKNGNKAGADQGQEIPDSPTRTLGTLETWSSKHGWQRRARSYDNCLARLQRALEADAILKMQERHIEIALTMQNIAADKLSKLDPESLSTGELRHFINDAIRIEREARSMFDANADIEVTAETSSDAKVGVRIVEVVKDYGDLGEDDEGDDEDNVDF